MRSSYRVGMAPGPRQRGRHVARLLSTMLDAGTHDVTWEGRDDDGAAAAAGVYFVRATGGGETATRKVVLAK